MSQTTKKPDTGMNVKIKNVRLSFPHLFKAHAFEEGKDPSFNATFIFDKKQNAESIKAVKDAINAVAKAMWPTGIPKNLKGICLREGKEKVKDDDTYVDGYGEDKMFVSAGSKTRVPVVDRNPNNVLVETDGRPYAGCRVNATIRVWAQDHEKWGRRVNAQLKAVQFAGDDKPFGESQVDPTKEFENEEGSESPSTEGNGDGGDSII